jgi:hypothetical protein
MTDALKRLVHMTVLNFTFLYTSPEIARSLTCGKRLNMQLSIWMLVFFAFCASVTPIAALDNESLGLVHVSRSRSYAHWMPVGFCITMLFFVGRQLVALSNSLVGPLMGITSILWPMMRNDATISPKASWI